MDGSTVAPPEGVSRIGRAPGRPAADLDPVERDLHLVEPGRPELADPRQQRLALQARCEEIALRLSRTHDLAGRLEIYRWSGVTARELTTAAALYPELMPTLNGEWEWIAVSLVDYEDD